MPDEPVNPFVLPPSEPVVKEELPPEVETLPVEPATEEPRPPAEESEKAKCLAQIQQILAEHDNNESNIGVSHPEYWRLIAKYRSLNAS